MAGRIVAITVTGGRPLAWGLCKYMMSRQTLKPDLWVIVDDCEPRSLMDIETCPIAVIYPEKVWQPGENSQAANLLAALEFVNADDKVIIIEDDDYYHPHYIATAVDRLHNHEMVGESSALYYNIANRTWKNCANFAHSSLCATAVKGVAVEMLRAACRNRPKFIDLELWRKGGSRIKNRLYATRFCVGIKGLPGRPGIGSGHKMVGKPDKGYACLIQHVDEDMRKRYGLER